ncbi:MAG: metal ABC transporter permease [Verrucomicrobia bacterium]|nr:metal ABC transporter permease [Verrucomicrobiota bacterium]
MKLAALDAFLEYGFITRALIAGLLMSLTCGILSPFVVLRRLSFSADGLAHASLGGLALGMFLLANGPAPSLASYAVSFVFTCLVAAAIAYFSGGQRVHSDTAVGACYVAAFALGILLLSLRQRYSGHLEHFFFGSLLAVNPLECWLLAGLALLALTLVLACWRWLGQWTFDEELALASGVPTGVLRYALILLIAATVILSTRVVGVLLVTAMLVLPGAVSTLLGRNMGVITSLSLGVALTSTLTGLGISNSADVPPGPAIVLTAFALFVIAYLVRRHRDRRLSHASLSNT